MTGFTPNMTMSQVAEMDRRRGQGDQSTFSNPDGIVRKRPWLNADGTHKSAEDREDDMQDTKTALEKSIENLKKYVLSSAHPPSGASAPSGSVTGVSSAGGSSGAPSPSASAALSAVSPSKPPPMPKPSMKSFTDKERIGDGIAEMLDGMKETKKSDAASQAQQSAQQRDNQRRQGKKERDIRAHQMSVDTSKSIAGEPLGEAIKALNSASMHVLRPLGPYDPYQIVNSAMAVHVRQIAPPELEAQVRPAPTYKSCLTHGLMHKSDAGCHLCVTQKSLACKSCGSGLVKMRGNGGAPTCPAGH